MSVYFSNHSYGFRYQPDLTIVIKNQKDIIFTRTLDNFYATFGKKSSHKMRLYAINSD